MIAQPLLLLATTISSEPERVAMNSTAAKSILPRTPFYAAYRTGRLLNEMQWLIPQVVGTIKPLSELQSVLAQVQIQIGEFVAQKYRNHIRQLIESASNDFVLLRRGESFGEEMFYLEHNFNDEEFQQLCHGAEDFCRDFLNGIDSAIVPTSRSAAAIALGRHVDKVVHPIPAFDFNRQLRRAENFDLGAANWGGNAGRYVPHSAPPPLAEQIKPYLKSSGEGLDNEDWLGLATQLCREAGLTVTVNIAELTNWLQASKAVDAAICDAIVRHERKRLHDLPLAPPAAAGSQPAASAFASKRFAVAFSFPGEKRDCVEGERRIARYVQPVNFGDFGGHQFERLAFAYHVRESKWERLEWLGQCGQDTGRDIWGVRAVEGQTSPEACCILCANWRKLTFAKIKSDIDKVLKSPSGKPDRIRVVCGHKISAQLREKVKKYAEEKAIHACELWSGQEFEEYLRATPRGESLLRRFTGGEEFPDSPVELTAFAS